MARGFKGISARARLLTYTGGAAVIIFLLHFLLPASTLPTQRWTTGSSSMIRSTLLRDKAQALKAPYVHPIPTLMAEARDEYAAQVARQSKTLPEAVEEYRRRYNQAPPKGFDEWFKFAQEHNAVMVDEYDQLIRDLKPYWNFDGEEVRRRCQQVGYLPSVDLVKIENGTTRAMGAGKDGFSDAEAGARAKGFRVMLELFQDKLPDMDFPINAKAEGRILVPWEENLYSNLTADSRST